MKRIDVVLLTCIAALPLVFAGFGVASVLHAPAATMSDIDSATDESDAATDEKRNVVFERPALGWSHVMDEWHIDDASTDEYADAISDEQRGKPEKPLRFEVIGQDVPCGAVFYRIEDCKNGVVCYATAYRNSRYDAPDIACVPRGKR